MFCKQHTSKLTYLICNHHKRITRFNAHHQLWVNYVIQWMKPGKEDPFLPYWEGRGTGASLPSPQNCMPHHNDWMAGGKLWLALGLGNSLLKAVGEQLLSTTLAWKTNQNKVEHIPAKVCSTGLWRCKSHWLIPHWWNWNLKVEIKYYSKHQHEMSVRGSFLKEKNLPVDNLWHKVHKPEWYQASESEVVSVAEQWSQQHPLLYPSESVV